MDYNFPFLDKLNFASFQNGGYSQNDRQSFFPLFDPGKE
jgi:hypothetical protein